MPYIGIEYHIKDQEYSELTGTWRDWVSAQGAKGNLNRYDIFHEVDNIDEFTDDGFDEGQDKGKIILHHVDTNNPKVGYLWELTADAAHTVRDSIKNFNWKKQSDGNILSLSPRILASIGDAQKWLKAKRRKVKIDREEVLEVREKLIEQGLDRQQAQEEAVRIVSDEAKQPSPRKGIPVRGRTLSSRSDRPWEETQRWKDTLAEYDIGPDDVIPEHIWKDLYYRHYRQTDARKESQKIYQQGDKYKTIQQTYNRTNPVGKEAESNPRKDYTYSEGGQTARQASQARVKGRTKRYNELAAPFRQREEPVPEYDINEQLFFEGWYPEAMDKDPVSGILKPLNPEKFREYWYGTGRLKGGSKERY